MKTKGINVKKPRNPDARNSSSTFMLYIAASYSTSIALSRMALISLCLLLLCSILPCFAAKFRLGGSDVAFVGSSLHQYHSPTTTQFFVSPISSSSTSRQHHHSIHYYDTNRRIRARQSLTQKQRAATSSDDDNSHNDDNDTSSTNTTTGGVRARVRQSVTAASQRVQNLVLSKSSKTGVPGIITDGSPIADILIDAGVNAAELAREEVRSAALNVLQRGGSPDNKQQQLSQSQKLETQARIEADATIAMDTISLAKTSVADAFDAAESALLAVENEVKRVRQELNDAKKDATLGLAVAEKAASEAKLKARMITEMALKESLKEEEIFDDGEEGEIEKGVQRLSITNEEEDADANAGGENAQMLKPDETLIVTIPKSESEDKDTNKAEEEGGGGISGKWSESDFDLVTDLSYEDVDYTLTDMAPPFISEDECLVPGEPVVRVEKAPQNSRRIFAGIDIPVSVDDVWKLLTDYPNLQKVVPNLVVNEVLELYEGGEGKITVDDTLSADKQCQLLANHMKGAVLKQVGGAKVVGINFSARTTLEVREWPTGMPDFAHFEDEMYEGKSRSARVRESKGRELTRYVFPRPFALSTLPHKDISMQSIENDDGEFRMYQGVWRMQPLVGCAPPGQSAMRLTYAVEVSPRPYLPVALVEGRIAQDLCANLKAIRNIFEAMDSASVEDR